MKLCRRHRVKKKLNNLTSRKIIPILHMLIFLFSPSYLIATEERGHSDHNPPSSLNEKERNLQSKVLISIEQSAWLYYRDVIDKRDEEAFSSLRQLRKNDKGGYAEHYLGCLYEDGVKGIVNKGLRPAALNYYEAIQKGHTESFKALIRLGKNDEEGYARYHLGQLYEEGVEEIVDESASEAAYWYYEATLKGHRTAFDQLIQLEKIDKEGHAQYYLADLYEYGVRKFINKSLQGAADYYNRAARRNHKEAFTELKRMGNKYEEGYIHFYLGKIYEDKFRKNEKLKDIEDLEDAVYWYRQAARQSHIEASKKIASLVKEECNYINNQIINKDTLEYSIGYLAFFRGIHYVTNLFNDKHKIEQNVENNDINTFLVSSAACTLAGSTFLSDTLSEEELKAGELIYDILSKFKKEHGGLYDKFHETYTNNHTTFHKLLEDPTKATDPNVKKSFTTYRRIFKEIAEENENWKKAVKRNPFVSFSCNARHGLRYSLGLKSFTGGDEVKLLPEYRRNGSPRNKHLGRVYGAIFHPKDILKLDPTFVLDKYARNKITINTNFNNDILAEKEISFLGYLPGDLIQISVPIDVPSFRTSDYPTEYEELFGINKEKYQEYRGIFSKGNNPALEKKIISQSLDKKNVLLEEKANLLIREKKGLRIQPDVLAPYYTPVENNNQTLIVSKWLHSLNSGKKKICYCPSGGRTPLTQEGIGIFSQNLDRQPINCHDISIIGYDIKNSGLYFNKIILNKPLSLFELTLDRCSLNPDDILKIASALKDNNTLRKLSLNGNKVGNEGARKLASALKKNKSLKYLYLNSTNISDISCFAGLFPTGKNYKGHQNYLNKTIEEIELFGNEGEKQESILNKITNGLMNNKLKGNTSEDYDSVEESY